MKNSINLLALFISFLNSYSQSNYTVTNNTSENYYVRLDIADFPVVCDFTSAPPNRYVYLYLRPNSGCGTNNVRYETLQTDEWVYKVTIFEYDNCGTGCGGSGASTAIGGMEPCNSHPSDATDSWNSCGNDSAVANAKTYCNIND